MKLIAKLRAFWVEYRCPQCGAPLKQVEKADYCDECDYVETYP